MSSNSIVDGTNINTDVFSYSAPKAHSSGGKVVNLYNKYVKDKESLTISTPLILTWGAQEGKDQQQNLTGKYTMSLQFPTQGYSNPDLDAFLKSMRELENKVKSDALLYSKEWFGKTISSPEVMEEKFNVMLRHPKIKGTQEPDLSKPPTLTVKIPCWNGSWKPEIYDEEGTPLYVNGKVNSHLSPLEYIKPKTHVICLIQCGGLWFVNGKVSITWNLKQAIVQKPKQSLVGVCLLRPKAEDKEKMKQLPPPEETIDDGDIVSNVIVEDSDNEDEINVSKTEMVAAVEVTETLQQTQSVVTQSTAEEPQKKRVVKKKPTGSKLEA
jgi:hypothetical protein